MPEATHPPRPVAGSTGEETREAILDVAQDLIQSLSFNAFSYQDIALRVGIRKASVHYYFPSKEDLGVALVERFRRLGRDWARSLLAKNATARDKLDAFFDFYGGPMREGDKICPGGILSAEFNTFPPRMRAGLQDFFAEQHRWLVQVLREGQEQGVFAVDLDVEAEAALIAASMQGGLQIARTTARPEHFHAVVRQLRRGIVQSPAARPVSRAASPRRQRRRG